VMRGIIAFDVDGTLDVGGGRIPHTHLFDLQKCGFVVGVVGNWEKVFYSLKGLDFYQAGIPSKGDILMALGAGKVFRLFVGDTEEDREAACRAGWNFIHVSDYRW